MSIAIAAGGTTVWTVPTAIAAAGSDATLALVSTPDEPYVGGRLFELDHERVINNTSDDLFIAFVRTDPQGIPLQDDPAWGVRLTSPSTMQPDTSFPLNGQETDRLRFTDDISWYSDVCPMMTGAVQVHEVVTELGGAVSALSASFVLHCRPGDTLFGALTVGAVSPPSLDGAQPLVDAESRFPTLVSEYVGGSAETVAIDVRHREILMRWDTPSGFRCADASVFIGNRDELASYSGRDDTWLVGDVDKSIAHTIKVELGSPWVDPCRPGTLSSSESSVWPTETRLNDVRVAASGDRLVLSGRVLNTVQGYSEPARLVEVAAKGRRSDGAVIVLGSTSTDVGGRFRLTVDANHARRVWAAVAPGAEPTSPESLVSHWYHFGDRSPSHRNPIS